MAVLAVATKAAEESELSSAAFVPSATLRFYPNEMKISFKILKNDSIPTYMG